MANGWTEFDDRQRRFGLSYPPRWQQMKPLSEDGAFACFAPPPATGFAEVVCFRVDAGQKLAAEHGADLWEQMAGNADVFQAGRVVSRHNLFSDGDSAGARVVIGYEKFNVAMVTDYCLLGRGQNLIHLALQAKVKDYPGLLEDFERMVASVSAPWFKRQVTLKELAGARARPENLLWRTRFAAIDEIANPQPGDGKSGAVWSILILGLLALGAWFFFFR